MITLLVNCKSELQIQNAVSCVFLDDLLATAPRAQLLSIIVAVVPDPTAATSDMTLTGQDSASELQFCFAGLTKLTDQIISRCPSTLHRSSETRKSKR